MIESASGTKGASRAADADNTSARVQCITSKERKESAAALHRSQDRCAQGQRSEAKSSLDRDEKTEPASRRRHVATEL